VAKLDSNIRQFCGVFNTGRVKLKAKVNIFFTFATQTITIPYTTRSMTPNHAIGMEVA
jgi:hypothetical protein